MGEMNAISFMGGEKKSTAGKKEALPADPERGGTSFPMQRKGKNFAAVCIQERSQLYAKRKGEKRGKSRPAEGGGGGKGALSIQERVYPMLKKKRGGKWPYHLKRDGEQARPLK